VRLRALPLPDRDGVLPWDFLSVALKSSLLDPIYFTAIIIIFLLSSAFLSSVQPSFPELTCVWFCAEDSPTGTQFPAHPRCPTSEVIICKCPFPSPYKKHDDF